MARLILSLVLALAACSTPVLGGSRVWESRLSHQIVHKRSLEAIPVDAAGYAIRTVDTNGTHHDAKKKRWFGIAPGQGMDPVYLWPDKTISYCFDSTESRDAIFEPLRLAIQSWATAGLSRLVYKYEEVANPGTACTGHSQRDKILVISHNDLSSLSTVVGRPPLNREDRPDYDGPTMQLSAVDTVGQLNIVANFAHEIGHAWGLFHEHQNPQFWSSPYYMEASPSMSGEVFGNNFDCSALKDYHIVRQKIQAKYNTDPTKLAEVLTDVCKRYSVASAWGFSASEWLPLSPPYKHTQGVPIWNAGEDDVDWDSIMLYPSGAGGVGSARPPTNPSEDPDIYDQRTPVLRKNNGDKIRPNAVPSQGDVAGIRYLYEDPITSRHQGAALEDLPNNKKNPRFTDFMKDIMFRKNKDCPAP